MASDGLFNPQPLIAKVKMLINLQLKDVLRREKLPVSGAKAALQERVIDRECTILSFARAQTSSKYHRTT